MAISAIVTVRMGEIKGVRKHQINVLNINLERITRITRSVSSEQFVDHYKVRYNNRRYELQRYEKELCIIVRDEPVVSVGKGNRGMFSASCKGARY